MRPFHLLAAVLAVAATASCSHDQPAAQPPAPAPTSSSTAVTVPAPTATIAPEVTVQFGGKSYPQKYYDCAQKLWDTRVDEWNRLVVKRDSSGAADVVVNGVTYRTSAEYGKAKGWPATMEATLTAEATKAACR